METTSQQLMQARARHWIARRQAQHLKPGSAKHDELQLDAPFNHNVLMLLAVGRDVQMLLPKDERSPSASPPSTGLAGCNHEA